MRRTLAAALVALVLAGALASQAPARAQQSPGGDGAPDVEAQALQLERQLLCPQCTNESLAVCQMPICADMRQLIRERLRAGATPDDILLFFRTRYGDRVLAELPKSGFNLVLWAWVGGSVLIVALAGGALLLRMRRSAAAPAAAPLDAAQERWLDDQLAGEDGR